MVELPEVVRISEEGHQASSREHLTPVPAKREKSSVHITQAQSQQGMLVITNSDLNRPCFAWNPYGKSGLFKTELVIAWNVPVTQHIDKVREFPGLVMYWIIRASLCPTLP